jgi:endoglucanase
MKIPELRVSGNQIIDVNGNPVWLQGVSIASLEWVAAGDYVLQSVDEAINNWNVNCVRLPMREHFWGGIGPKQDDGGEAYRQLIDDAVNSCTNRGVYMVIDLHRFRAPNEKDAEFWQDIATRYKNHPGVLFEIFNEPHDISWDVWRDGGLVTEEKKAGDALTENNEKLSTFNSVGIQYIIDIIRNTGANNIIIAGALDWSYNLSGIMEGYELDDRGGNGIVYSSHVYPWKSEWQKRFLCAAEKYPLFIGEVGCEVERMPFIPPDRHEDPYTWAPDMIGLIQQYKLHWAAWCFHPVATPRVILDWQYTPTPFWGEYVKRALAGEQFEMKRMR